MKPATRTRTAATAGLDKENTVAQRQKPDPPTSPAKSSSLAGGRVMTSSGESFATEDQTTALGHGYYYK